MKISYLIRVLAAAVIVSLAACGSSQEKTSSNDRSGSNERGANIDIGGGLPSYSPGGQGWGYKQTAAPGDFTTWATQFKPQIEQVLNAMAPGFKLQVTGHSCAIGPRDADGSGRPGNIYWSTERAKAVYNALVQAGLPAAKMTYRGVANDEPLAGVDAKDQKNRRVTFKPVQG